MILGNDISNFQGQIDWGVYKNNTNFVLMKAGEGTSYIDTWFGFNRSQSRLFDLPRGFYHFARPDLGNSAQDEAKFFCNLIDGDPIKEGEILALDIEIIYSDPVNWCMAWLNTVSAHFNGIKPLIYLNQSTASKYDWTPVIDAGYGLWIAAYTYDPNNNYFDGGKWETSVMQQWTDQQNVPGVSGNLDGDVFFGDVNAFKAYGYKPVVVSPPSTSQIPPISVPTPPVETPPVPPVVTPPTPTPPAPVPPVVVPPVTPQPMPLPTITPTPMEAIVAFFKWLFNIK